MKTGILLAITAIIVMSAVLLASCDSPVMEPATTTTADDATTATVADTVFPADTGTVADPTVIASVTAAKALESSLAADDVVAKAEAGKTAVDKTDNSSAYFQTAAADAEVVSDQDLTEDMRTADLLAITAAETQVKALADAAVTAANELAGIADIFQF